VHINLFYELITHLPLLFIIYSKFKKIRLMSIKTKLLITNAILILCVTFASVINIRTAYKVKSQLNEIMYTDKVLSKHAEADNSHDTLFAQVQYLMNKAITQDLKDMDKVYMRINSEGQNILNCIRENLALNIPQNIILRLKQAQKETEIYVELSKAIATTVKNNQVNFSSYKDKFATQYLVLEQSLKEVNDLIMEWNDSIEKEVFNAVEKTKIINYVIGLCLLFILSFKVIKIFVWLFNPLRKIIVSMSYISQGNLKAEIPYLNNQDEMGEMAKALEVFRDNAARVSKIEEDKKLAEAKAQEENKKVLKELADKFNNTVTQVSTTVGLAAEEMEATSKNMAESSKTNSTRVSELVQYASTASNNVSTIASAAEELTASVKEIERQVSESSNNINGAVKQAEIATSTISGLSIAADKISSVISLISDIAAQVNILALNATIEASRAGEAGKGFGVVALEVKGLAQQTTKALEQITEQINAIQHESSNAVSFITDISKTINEISKISSSISNTIQDQGVATTEIAKNIHQAAKWVEDLYKNSEGVQQFTTQNMNAANEMLSACGELSSQAGVLNNEVSKFIKSIV
jgi:methyl-accepting chemotaxis protein